MQCVAYLWHWSIVHICTRAGKSAYFSKPYEMLKQCISLWNARISPLTWRFVGMCIDRTLDSSNATPRMLLPLTQLIVATAFCLPVEARPHEGGCQRTGSFYAMQEIATRVRTCTQAGAAHISRQLSSSVAPLSFWNAHSTRRLASSTAQERLCKTSRKLQFRGALFLLALKTRDLLSLKSRDILSQTA